jgi:general secretion pathway protein G
MPRLRNNFQFRSAIPRAFTLVEILIVVVILGILAAIVIPQFSNASQTARENTLHEDLRFLRNEIQIYQVEHLDLAPGYPGGNGGATPDAADFNAQMTLFSSSSGTTSSSGSEVYAYGPYLSRMPFDPINALATMTCVDNGSPIPAADGTTGWIYKAQTMEIYANLVGNDSNGVAYSSY